MTGKFNIRPAEPKDYNAIVKIFDSWRPDNWDSEYAAKYYRGFFNNRHFYPDDEVLVGVLDVKVIGVSGYCADPEETEGIYWLNWFYVHKGFRKHGYGRQLMDHVIAILKNKKMRKLYVNTVSYEFYQPAQDLYLKSGFKQEGVLKDFYGRGEHQVIFGKHL